MNKLLLYIVSVAVIVAGGLGGAGYGFANDDPHLRAMQALPACVREGTPTFTVLGYQKGVVPDSLVLSVVVSPDSTDEAFEASHEVLVKCLQVYPWQFVSLLYAVIEKVDTLDAGKHYTASLAMAVLIDGAILRSLNVDADVVGQLNSLIEAGFVYWMPRLAISGALYPHNADWALAIQRHERANAECTSIFWKCRP